MKLDIQKDWEAVKKQFREHFKGSGVKEEEDRIIYRKSGEKLAVSRNGEVSGKMPLHTTEIEDAEEIAFRDSEVEIFSGETRYVFGR